MPLVTASQFNLQPDIQQAIQQGMKTRAFGQQEANRQLLFQQSQEQLGAQQRALGVPQAVPQGETQEQAMQRVMAANPDVGRKILETTGVRTQQQKEEAAAFATEMLGSPPESRQRLIDDRARRLAAQGRDATHTLLLKDLPEEQLIPALTGWKTAALTELQRSTQERRGETISVDQVQSSSMLPGGVVQIVRKSGAVETISPDELSADVIQRAEQRGVDLQQKRAQGRGLGADAAKVSAETFKQVGNLRSNNATLKQVIDEVRGGADTGPLASKLPSFRAESVRLDNLRNRLGLDVVSSVTFGALSESELEMALETALPRKLDGPELIQWADNKIAAQEKLARYLEDQSIFLSRSGNTPAGWIEQQRAEAETKSAPQAGAQPAQQAAPAALPPGVTEEDIAETMRVHSVTREQVLQRLGAQ